MWHIAAAEQRYRKLDIPSLTFDGQAYLLSYIFHWQFSFCNSKAQKIAQVATFIHGTTSIENTVAWHHSAGWRMQDRNKTPNDRKPILVLRKKAKIKTKMRHLWIILENTEKQSE